MKNLKLNVDLLNKIREQACTGMFSDLTDGNNKVRIWNEFKSTSNKNILGIIRTVDIETIKTDDENLSLGLSFLTSMSKGEVIVVKGSNDFAYFGELMANLASRQGLSGALIFGASRASRAITKMNFPLYAKSFHPVDIKGRGRVSKVDSDLLIDNYKISSLSWVFADSDGAFFFPSAMAVEILTDVEKMIDKETLILKQISENVSGAELANLHKGF